jgi:uncharacterized protein YfaS (alpha-2-macroglobulin family)
MALYVVLVVLAAFLAAVIPARGSLAGAVRLASTHQTEAFTELYFVDPGRLPGFAAPGKKQTVQFRIQSHAAQRQAYPYSVTVSGPSGTKVTNGSVTLSPGAGATIPFSFTITKANQKVTITVSLVGTEQRLTLRSQS